MGSFSSEFSDGDTNEGTSSYVFLVTFLIIVLIILLVAIIKRLFHKFEFDNPKYHNCTCSKCKNRLAHQRAVLKLKNINIVLYLYIILFVVVLYFVYICCCEIIYTSPSLRFDPYALLNVTEGSSAADIKRSYKKLALQYHPDKNKEDDAKERFMLISKAFKALSTEEGKKNFLRYGDPDGPNYYRLNISLPSFILNKNLSQVVIGLFIVFIIIILPVSFLRWFSNSKEYNENGMMTIDQSIFYHYLSDNTLQTAIPFILGLAFEMNTLIKAIPKEQAFIDEFYSNYIKYMPKHSIDKIPAVNKKAICLLYSYFFRSPLIIENYNEELGKVLSQCPFLLKYMIEMSFECSLLAPYAQTKIKFMQGTICTLACFIQSLYQQGDFSLLPEINDTLLELPHFTQAIIKSHSYFKSLKSINVLLNLSREEKEKYLNKDNTFTKEQIEDIGIALNSIPHYNIAIESSIDSFHSNSNSVTFKGNIVIQNVDKEKLLGWRHSVSFTEAFTDELIVLITLNGKLVDSKILPVDKVSSSFKFVMLTDEEGELNYNLEIYSLNYKGIDQVIPVSFKASVQKKKTSQYQRQLSQEKMDYFCEMFKQRIPYVEYNTEDTEGEDESKETPKGKIKTD